MSNQDVKVSYANNASDLATELRYMMHTENEYIVQVIPYKDATIIIYNKD